MITTDLVPSPLTDQSEAVQDGGSCQSAPIMSFEPKQDLREALFNDGEIGPASRIQLPLEAITSLTGIVIDLDPGLLRPDNVLFPPATEPSEFYEKIKPVLVRHPLASQAEIRASGTGLHVIVRIDPPVKLDTHGLQRYWDAIVKCVQRSLPADLHAPGLTALTRAIGSINSKNGHRVDQLEVGRPVREAAVIEFVKKLWTARFQTIGQILLGADRVENCPKCGKSVLTILDSHGRCYSCGRLSLDELFDLVYLNREPDPALVENRPKRKARRA